jgi:hypothetical protein
MNDKSSNALLLLIIAGLLVLSGLMGYMWYRYATQPAIATQSLPAQKEKTALASVRDSLKQAYQQTLTALPHTISYDSLEYKMAELARLKEEVGELLQKNSTLAELETARLKILELQTKIEELRRKTLLIEEENKRLNAALNKLVRRSAGNDVPATNFSSRPEPRVAIVPAVQISLTDWRLTGLVTKGGAEEEVQEADEAEKLKGSFHLRATQNFNGELFIVVRQPDGRVLQTAWDGGAFESASGRKMYSCKLMVDYTKGEEKKLSFSIPTDGLQNGTYTVHVYQNGILVGSSRALF